MSLAPRAVAARFSAEPMAARFRLPAPDLALWTGWMDKAAALAERHMRVNDDDPFCYNETASVSHLCSAATLAGLLSLAEYSATKKHGDGRRKARPRCRCDLWMGSPQRSWAFEFKQLLVAPVNALSLDRAMESARTCAHLVRESEADRRVAGLVVSMYWYAGRDRARDRPLIDAFAAARDCAWRIGSDDIGDPETFLLFDFV